jgi:hypothetical protein
MRIGKRNPSIFQTPPRAKIKVIFAIEPLSLFQPYKPGLNHGYFCIIDFIGVDLCIKSSPGESREGCKTIIWPVFLRAPGELNFPRLTIIL